MEFEFPTAPYYAKDHPGVLPTTGEIIRVHKILEFGEEPSIEVAEYGEESSKKCREPYLRKDSDAEDSNQPVVQIRACTY